MDSLGQVPGGFAGAPGERPPNMLASIQSYLTRTQELMQNPAVLLPSLPDPPAPGQPTVFGSVTTEQKRTQYAV